MIAKIQKHLKRIKQKKPIILNLTNHVTMDFVANGLLCLGASPIMSEDIHEVDALCALSDALVINPGTLNDAFMASAQQACGTAAALGRPIIFDPVGVGASALRTEFAQNMVNTHPITVIRGNAGEIMALNGSTIQSKGVDSEEQTDTAIQSGQNLAQKQNNSVVISGAVDVIISTTETLFCKHGAPIMPYVTGTGCLMTAVIGAFVATHDNVFEATQHAVFFYAWCGEYAAKKAQGPGSFKIHFLDALYHGEVFV